MVTIPARPILLTPAVPGSSGLLSNGEWCSNLEANGQSSTLSATNLQITTAMTIAHEQTEQTTYHLMPNGEWSAHVMANDLRISPCETNDLTQLEVIVPDHIAAGSSASVTAKDEPFDETVCISDDDEDEEECGQKEIAMDGQENEESNSEQATNDLDQGESEIVFELMKKAMYKNCYHYLGLSVEFRKLIEMIVQGTGMAERDLLLILRKCKHNEAFQTLGDYFGVSEVMAEQIFTENVKQVATSFRKFIFWPNAGYIKKNLPTEFQYKYKTIQSIVMCYNLVIDEPDALPIKYIISYTPYGFVTFVSSGFSDAESTDTEILMSSGFLANIRKGVDILVRGGFVGLDEKIQERGAVLYRAKCDDVNGLQTIEQEDLYMNTQVIRSLIEKMDNRLTRYQLLKPYAAHPSLAHSMDDAMVIMSALVNIRSPHIRLIPRKGM